jgi:hypothetical protein
VSNLLDIVLAAPRNSTNLTGCLSALADQLQGVSDAVAQVRVVVAHAGPISPALAKPFSRGQWIECDRMSTLPDLWGSAIAETHGRVVAVLDADCAVGDDWLIHALTLAASAHDIIGGAVEPHGLKSLAAWAAYFVDYGAFLPPLPSGTPRELAGNNLLIQRALLDDPRVNQFVAPQFWKAHWLNAVRTQGASGVSASELVVTYTKHYAAHEWFAKRLRHARCYATMRLAQSSWHLRLSLIVLAPIVPLILFARVVRNVWPRRRYRREFVLSIPWICVGLVAWACGEWVGCVFGAGHSCSGIV